MLLCLISLSLFSFAFALSSKPAAAADSPITILAQSDTVRFPNYIDFSLTAVDNANPITSATIYITFKDIPYAGANEYPVTISKPAQRVTLRFRDNTSTTEKFHSPGTPVQYYWVLQDSAMRQSVVLPQDFTIIDTRFSWQRLSQGLLQVNWYNRPASFGQLLLSKANASIAHISQVLGSGLLRPISLWVYASNSDFHGALAPNSYEWVGGEADPYISTAFISAVDANDDTLVRDMPHELTHLVSHQLVSQGPIPPTWFDEGMAVYNQLYHEPDMRGRFQEALVTKSLLRLYTISDGFPANADQAYLAYAQSWDLIDYMYKTFGQAKMTLLIQKMNNTQSDFDQQLTASIGLDSLHLENQWRVHLGQSTVLTPDQITPTAQPTVQPTPTVTTATTDGTTPILVTTGVLLILLPILGIVAIFVYQRRKRQQQAQTALAAQGNLATNGQYFPHYPQSPYQPMPPNGNGQFSYTNPAGYGATRPPANPPQTYMPFSYPEAQQAFGTPPQSPSTPQTPPAPVPQQAPQQPPVSTNAPGFSWPTNYPTPDTSGQQPFVNGNGQGQPAPEPFGLFQERVFKQPGKQAPQE
jgi:hypothetical protein